MNLPSEMQDPGKPGVLPCAVCEKPVYQGEWFILAKQAKMTVCTGMPLNSPEQPVHVICLLNDPYPRPV